MVDFQYLESSLLTTIEKKVNKRLDGKYPNINFVSEISDDTDYEFPNIYYEELTNSSTATTTERDLVAVRYGIQLQVADNKKKSNAKEIAYILIDVLKELGFVINTMPIYSKQAKIHIYILRATRNIGSGDLI